MVLEFDSGLKFHLSSYGTIIDRVWVVRICCLEFFGVWRCCRYERDRLLIPVGLIQHCWWSPLWPTGNWTHQSCTNAWVFLSLTLVHLIYSFLKRSKWKIPFKIDLVRTLPWVYDGKHFYNIRQCDFNLNIFIKFLKYSFLYLIALYGDNIENYVSNRWDHGNDSELP